MLNILQCFKKTHRWRKARAIQGRRRENVEYMNANMLQISWVQILYAFQVLLAFWPFLSIFTTTTWPIHRVRGQAILFISQMSLSTLASPIAQLYCTPPMETTLTFGSRSCHSHKESSGWQQGHPCIKALKFNSTYPTRARVRRWTWGLLSIKTSNLVKSIFSVFNGMYRLKYKIILFICICSIYLKTIPCS